MMIKYQSKVCLDQGLVVSSDTKGNVLDDSICSQDSIPYLQNIFQLFVTCLLNDMYRYQQPHHTTIGFVLLKRATVASSIFKCALTNSGGVRANH